MDQECRLDGTAENRSERLANAHPCAATRVWLRRRRKSLATDSQPERIKGHTRRLARAIVRTRVQRACPPPRRSKLRSLRFRLTAKTAYRCVASPLRTANASLVCASVGERRRERISSPCGICTDHVQNSIRDRRRLVASNSFVTKASPSLNCANSAEIERKQREMSAGELCPHI